MAGKDLEHSLSSPQAVRVLNRLHGPPPVLVKMPATLRHPVLGNHMMRYRAVSSLEGVEQRVPCDVVVADQTVPLEFPGVMDRLQRDVAVFIGFPTSRHTV